MKTESKQITVGNFCPNCGVPEDQHGTACGWKNANTIFFPWEQLIPADITIEEKQLRYVYSNDIDKLQKLLPHRSQFPPIPPTEYYDQFTSTEGEGWISVADESIDNTMRRLMIHMGNPREKVNSISLKHYHFSYEVVHEIINILVFSKNQNNGI